jgi:hypothetical protein
MANALFPIEGNTYPVKDQLKALGCRWNGDMKRWEAPGDVVERAKAIVAGAPSKTSSGSSKRGSYGFKSRRIGVCWECGARGPLDSDGMCGRC